MCVFHLCCKAQQILWPNKAAGTRVKCARIRGLLCFACFSLVSPSPSLSLSPSQSHSYLMYFVYSVYLAMHKAIACFALLCVRGVCVILCIRRLESNTRVKGKGTKGILYDLHTLESSLSCLWRHLSKKLPKELCLCLCVCACVNKRVIRKRKSNSSNRE